MWILQKETKLQASWRRVFPRLVLRGPGGPAGVAFRVSWFCGGRGCNSGRHCPLTACQAPCQAGLRAESSGIGRPCSADPRVTSGRVPPAPQLPSSQSEGDNSTYLRAVARME